jgi:excisionase family DNA binding protein
MPPDQTLTVAKNTKRGHSPNSGSMTSVFSDFALSDVPGTGRADDDVPMRREHEVASYTAAAMRPRPNTTRRHSQQASPVLPELLTIQDAMAVARLGKTTLYRLAGQGHFEIIKLGRMSRIRRQAFLNFLSTLRPANHQNARQ